MRAWRLESKGPCFQNIVLNLPFIRASFYFLDSWSLLHNNRRELADSNLKQKILHPQLGRRRSSAVPPDLRFNLQTSLSRYNGLTRGVTTLFHHPSLPSIRTGEQASSVSCPI